MLGEIANQRRKIVIAQLSISQKFKIANETSFSRFQQSIRLHAEIIETNPIW